MNVWCVYECDYVVCVHVYVSVCVGYTCVYVYNVLWNVYVNVSACVRDCSVPWSACICVWGAVECVHVYVCV